jgi:hypothetical protein
VGPKPRWAKREKTIQRVIANTSGMYGDLQGLVASSDPGSYIDVLLILGRLKVLQHTPMAEIFGANGAAR